MPVRSTHIPASTPSGATDWQVLSYIAEMCADLRQMADGPQLRMVRYLLDMARLEAEMSIKRLPSRGAETREDCRRR